MKQIKLLKGKGAHELKAEKAGAYTGFMSRSDANVGLLPAVCCRLFFIHLGEERQNGVKFPVYGTNVTGEA